jgi:malate dehydrogenase
VAADDARVAVVGNPCNTNCMIAASQAKRLPQERFTAMTRLDQNRACTQIAKKAGVPVTAISDLIIYGNHSPTMYSDFYNAKISGRAVTDVITDHDWLTGTLLPTVGKRGAAIIEARGASSAFSAANALIDHVRALVTVGPTLHSIAVPSDGSYGFASGIWASVPVKTVAPGTYEVVKGFQHNAFAQGKIKATNDELVGERDVVKDMLA